MSRLYLNLEPNCEHIGGPGLEMCHYEHNPARPQVHLSPGFTGVLRIEHAGFGPSTASVIKGELSKLSLNPKP